MREDLSKRSNNWQKFAASGGIGREELAKKVIGASLRGDASYTLQERPGQLSKIYGKWGILPDFSVTKSLTGKIAFFETKRQGAGGNAHERACKYFAPGLQERLEAVSGFPRPIFTIFMDGLTTDPKKVTEITAWYDHAEWADRFFLWQNRDIESLLTYWEGTVRSYLD